MKTKMKIKKELDRTRLVPVLLILLMSFTLLFTNDVSAQNEKPDQEHVCSWKLR